MKIVIFNGPPRSGKDTCAEFLATGMYYRSMKLAAPLKLATHALYGLWPIPDNYFEKTKDDANPEFMGLSPRQAYIKVSEELVKPILGDDWWARVLVNRIKAEDTDRIVLSDCGFTQELEVLAEAFGPESLLLFRLHREGCDFSKDSRSYMYPGESIAQIDVYNNRTLADLKADVMSGFDVWSKARA
jgi:hypothetical protein